MPDTQPFRVDAATHSIHFSRWLPTTPDRVFDAWTRPDLMSQWWDPSGKVLAECVIDLREGGVLRLVNAGQEHHPFEGRYRTIERPSRIVFDAMGATGTILITPEGKGTRMTLAMLCGSAAHLEQFVRMGIAEGTNRTLDNLVTHLA